MSSMKDVHADVMDLLEQSVDDEGLDTSACSGEGLHAARAFVGSNAEETLPMSESAYDRAHRIPPAISRGKVFGTVLAQVACLTGLEVRRFAVSLDASHRAHATRAAAARELGYEPHHIASLRKELADALPPFEIPTDLRAVVLEAFPLSPALAEYLDAAKAEAVA